MKCRKYRLSNADSRGIQRRSRIWKNASAVTSSRSSPNTPSSQCSSYLATSISSRTLRVHKSWPCRSSQWRMRRLTRMGSLIWESVVDTEKCRSEAAMVGPGRTQPLPELRRARRRSKVRSLSRVVSDARCAPARSSLKGERCQWVVRAPGWVKYQKVKIREKKRLTQCTEETTIHARSEHFFHRVNTRKYFYWATIDKSMIQVIK